MQIQTALTSTNVLCKELSELKNEYYQNDNALFNNFYKTNKYSFNQNEGKNIDIGFTQSNILDHQYFRQLIHHTKDFICLTDKRGQVLEWSDGLSDITGINENIILGKYIWNIYNYLHLTIDERTAEVIKIRELFLSCILTKRKFQLQNSMIFSNTKTKLNHGNINVSISMINNNEESLVMFIFTKNKK